MSVSCDRFRGESPRVGVRALCAHKAAFELEVSFPQQLSVSSEKQMPLRQDLEATQESGGTAQWVKEQSKQNKTEQNKTRV